MGNWLSSMAGERELDQEIREEGEKAPHPNPLPTGEGGSSIAGF